MAKDNREEFDPFRVPIRPAATLVVIRDAPAGEPGERAKQAEQAGHGNPSNSEVSVLLLQRSLSASFVPGAFVFAGGAIDDMDAEMAGNLESGSTSRSNGQRRGEAVISAEAHERAAKIASLRECFEEAGLLPACTTDGAPLKALPPEVQSLRKEVHGGRLSFEKALAVGAITPNLEAIVPFGRWVTPAGPPRRFDTRFFLASAAADQIASEDGSELISSCWMTPTSALAAADAGELLLIFPTRKSLERLRGVFSFDLYLRQEGISS